MSTPTPRLQIDAETQQIFVDDRRLHRTEQRYWLYALLARERIRGADEGWVYPDQIWLLQSWQGNSLDSVGKALAREIGTATETPRAKPVKRAAPRPRIIESKGGSRVGPYRIRLSPNQIRVMPSMEFLERQLLKATAPTQIPEPDVNRFLVYARNQMLGVHTFDRGYYDNAKALYEAALKDAKTPAQQLPVLLALSRFYLGKRDYVKAEEVQNRLAQLIPQVHGFDLWARACLALQRGQRLYSEFRHMEARDEFQAAITIAQRTFDYGILGEAYEGMGHAIVGDDLNIDHIDLAEGYIQRALELSVVAGLQYQMQQSYRSLGVVEYLRADYYWNHGNKKRARMVYERARRRIEDALALGDEFGLGRGDGEAQLQLASIAGRLEDLDEAKRWAAEARDIAMQTRDGKVDVKASRILAFTTEDDDVAIQLLRDCIARTKPEFWKYFGTDIYAEFGERLGLPAEAMSSLIDYSQPARE